jgi:hypothetical protein
MLQVQNWALPISTSVMLQLQTCNATLAELMPFASEPQNPHNPSSLSIMDAYTVTQRGAGRTDGMNLPGLSRASQHNKAAGWHDLGLSLYLWWRPSLFCCSLHRN